MRLPKDLVLAEGKLNERLIFRREVLYTGLNGRNVERFYLTQTESYIFKPLTNNEQLGKEVSVYENILPFFPAIFPKLISFSKNKDPERSWMIFEDVGPLSHVYMEETVFGVVKWIAWWHSLDVEEIGYIPPAGLKPSIGKIVADIQAKKDELLSILKLEKQVRFIFEMLDDFMFSKTMVLSHGDLHVGNYAVVDSRVVVLDWEYAHLNTPFWDLYHVIDLSHPLYPKTASWELREQALTLYLDEAELEYDRTAFFIEYHLFAAVFSMWMILLIRKDLRSGDRKWPQNQLERQLGETVSSFNQCAEWLNNRKS